MEHGITGQYVQLVKVYLCQPKGFLETANRNYQGRNIVFFQCGAGHLSADSIIVKAEIDKFMCVMGH